MARCRRELVGTPEEIGGKKVDVYKRGDISNWWNEGRRKRISRMKQ